ncbi:Zn-ribbon domain-containing OB-fold protein [Sphingomonas sp. GB1N7]|uniref:Zn-ribbon domain-containing OB-fold protein n=1 Tax=Parasphingomonas caseinilytica TaxID=3096158 RepID=UPI002FC5839E
MRAIAEGLFTDEAMPRLIGGKHRDSGRIVFPWPRHDEDFEAHPLRRDGTIWSYTIQRFRPKSPPYAGPAAFSPFPIAYVELADEVIVEARLTDVAIDAVHIGMAVELTQVQLDPEAKDPVAIPAFRPVGAEA